MTLQRNILVHLFFLCHTHRKIFLSCKKASGVSNDRQRRSSKPSLCSSFLSKKDKEARSACLHPDGGKTKEGGSRSQDPFSQDCCKSVMLKRFLPPFLANVVASHQFCFPISPCYQPSAIAIIDTFAVKEGFKVDCQGPRHRSQTCCPNAQGCSRSGEALVQRDDPCHSYRDCLHLLYFYRAV